MPIYIHCPHCEHPQIVAPRRRGKAQFCRQCGSAYKTSTAGDEIRPLWVSSIDELRPRTRAAGAVYVIE